MEIINGRKIKKEMLENIKKEILKLKFPPIFCDILVGDDPVSTSYIRIKGRAAESVGIKFKTVNFPKNTTTEEIVNEIENLNRVPHICGIIVQLPLPQHIDENRVLDSINPLLDVDCLGKDASEKFYNNTGFIGYPTALACMKMLKDTKVDLKSKKIVVLGQGKLVGLPVSHLLKSSGYSISTINSKTEDTLDIIKNADVIISAIGKGSFITGNMVKEDTIIIDAGTSEENGSVIGDVNMNSVKDKVSFITPTPGGVGPVTVAMLFQNILLVSNKKNNNE